jgi:hypothetical protein
MKSDESPGNASALEAAYRATNYCVDGPGSRFVIQIGQVSAALDELLSIEGAMTWAYITACNPHSTKMPSALNAGWMCELESAVLAAGYRFFRGEGVGQAGDWPAEPSLLILGIDMPSAMQLAREFEQNACVFGARGEPGRLVWAAENGEQLHASRMRTME